MKWPAVLSCVMKSPAVLLCPTWDITHPFVQHLHAIKRSLPISQLSYRILSRYLSAYVQVTLVLLNSGPKVQCWNLEMPNRSHEVLCLRPKMNVIKERKVSKERKKS